ncbi:MAG: hypothetical protein PVF70_13105, partial [Anaerolineales bacterium]
ADPEIIRARSPALAQIADQALQEGAPFLKPKVYQKRLRVGSFNHDRVRTESGAVLQGQLIGQHLPSVSEVVAVLCTIGSQLEAHAVEVMAIDASRGLALDGVGSAAVEALAHAVCSQVEQQSKAAGMQTTIPLSPGMTGWPVAQGQAQIFALWQAEAVDIQLTSASMMIPRKSLSMLIGVGKDVIRKGTACDYCGMRQTCHYRDHNA